MTGGTGGRPSKLTPELQDALCKVIQSGCFLETAAVMCGINRVTLLRWMHRGAKEESGTYRDFRAAVRKAMAHAELRDLMKIQRAGDDDWRAIAWRLERRYPKRWGKRDGDEAKSKKLTPAQLAKRLRQFQVAAGAVDTGGATTEVKETHE